MNRRTMTLCAAVAALCAGSTVALGQQLLSSTFTYQGYLTDPSTGGPIEDTDCDFDFRLYTQPTGGAPVDQHVAAVAVRDGLFSAELTFSAGHFDGRTLYLEAAPCMGAPLPRSPIRAVPYALHTRGLYVSPGGMLGIGTDNPTSMLTVDGDISVPWGAKMMTLDTDHSARTVFDIGWDGSNGDFLDLYTPGAGQDDEPRVRITEGGRVGIGRAIPAAGMDVLAGDVPAIRAQNNDNTTNGATIFAQNDHPSGIALRTLTESSDSAVVVTNSGDGDLIRGFNGGCCPVFQVKNDGTTRVSVLEVTGADLAERFPSTESTEPGTVMEIDPSSTGELRIARGAYNTRVAGVVSGAGNLPAGAILGNLPGHEDAPPIALTGRVWVKCDASSAPIRVGDMMTTSDTPGHAMRVGDRDQAQGAILGKAMTALDSGTGLVLVLVTLQ